MKREYPIFVYRWSTHWFRLDLDIPKDWVGEEVQLVWKSDTEALVWENGQPLQVTILRLLLSVTRLIFYPVNPRILRTEDV